MRSGQTEDTAKLRASATSPVTAPATWANTPAGAATSPPKLGPRTGAVARRFDAQCPEPAGGAPYCSCSSGSVEHSTT